MDDLPAHVEPEELGPEVVALMLRAIASTALARLDETKAELRDYEDGQRLTFRSPLDGRKLGMVYRTDPDPEWIVADRKALMEHLGEFEGNWEVALEIIGDEAEVLAVLNTHAPHLLKETRYIPDEVVEAALEASKQANKAVAPGIKKVKPAGTLTVKPDKKEAGPAFAAMIKAGWLTWDGRRAIEKGAA